MRGNGVALGRPLIEVGAGYGRLAYVFLKAHPGCKYWIIDLPPALYVSQQYLSAVFPDRRCSRSAISKPSMRSQLRSKRRILVFSAPTKFDCMPDKVADAFIAISNLHEMRREQIDFYFDEVDRLIHGVFYNKQWLRSRTTIEEGFVLRRGEYPIKAGWRNIYDERHPFQAWFFHALYAIS